MRKYLFASVVLVAAPAWADPVLSKVTKVSAVRCETDGGTESCSNGVKYMGEMAMKWANKQLDDAPVACPDAKPGTVTFHFGFEYNDGAMYMLDSEAAQAKLPTCVKQLATRVEAKWLEWYKFLLPIDQSIDIRSNYAVTLTITK